MVSHTSRITYFGLFLVTVICAWVFRDYQSPEFCTATNDIFCKNLRCPADQQSPTCMARAFVLRVAFATAVFHAMIALFTIGASDYSNPRIMVHTALWPIKILIWVVLHLIVFFIPSQFFLGFGWLAFVCGILFLIVQTVIFIEFTFELNETWIGNDGADNTTGKWHMAILAISLVCFGLAIGMEVVMFSFFGTNNSTGESDGCELYQFFASINLILFVFLTIFSFRATEWMPATGILPSALVAAFLSFKTLSALYSQTKCNTLAGQSDQYTAPPEFVSAMSITIAVILAAYSSVTIGVETDENGRFWGPSDSTSDVEERKTPLVEMDSVAPNEMHVDVEGGGASEAEPLKGRIGYNVAAFHVAIAFSTCYIAMQMTNWMQEFSKTDMDKGVVSMWIKVIDGWILAIAFGWAMIAPKVLTGREFT
jgi:hypothetical protein